MNSDASRSVTAEPAGGPGSSGRADWSGGEDGGPGLLLGAAGGSGEPHEEGDGSIRPQGGSGLETGGNSDSGGADDDLAGGNSSGGGNGAQGGDWGSRKPAGTPGTDPAGGTWGANGLRTLGLNPHASQNGPDTGAPQSGQVSPPFAAPSP